MIEDQINLDLWRQVLKKFAIAIGHPVSTIDTEGNEIIPPDNLPFYCQLVRHQKPEICSKCRKKYFEEIKTEGKEILFYRCSCGLLNIMVPIKVENEIIGAVICESIKRKVHNARTCARIGKKINIPSIELIDALEKIKTENRNSVVQYGTLMHVLSQAMPTIAHDKMEDEKKINELAELASHDKLTGLLNRNEFMKKLQEGIVRLKRSGKPLSIVMMDLDDFKQYNDTFGHLEGDYLLTQASSILKFQVREIDTVGRYGGEEFILILPDANKEIARTVCERIRKTLEQRHFRRQVTASFGICTASKAMPAEELIDKADKALYEAKGNGKNQIVSKTSN
jgi:diguanylate cyclase (GGDEF)-like protein